LFTKKINWINIHQNLKEKQNKRRCKIRKAIQNQEAKYKRGCGQVLLGPTDLLLSVLALLALLAGGLGLLVQLGLFKHFIIAIKLHSVNTAQETSRCGHLNNLVVTMMVMVMVMMMMVMMMMMMMMMMVMVTMIMMKMMITTTMKGCSKNSLVEIVHIGQEKN
jgi:hypothetical protein